MQLEMVEGAGEDYVQKLKSRGKSEADTYWHNSGYALIVAITSAGNASGPWILWNFNSYHEDPGMAGRYTIDEDDTNWSLLENDEVQRAGARIAENVHDLSADTVWNLGSVMYKYDLVAVVYSGVSRVLLRQKIHSRK